MRIALDLLLEREQAVDLVVDGLEGGAHLAAELGYLQEVLDDLDVEVAVETVGAAVDLDVATAEMIGTLQSLSHAMKEGSTDERRVVVRAFVREVRLHPSEATGRAEVFRLPEFTLDARHEPAIATPAVPGVRAAPRAGAETVPGHVIDFTWSINETTETGRADARLPVACPGA